MTVACRLPGTCGCRLGPVCRGDDYQVASERGVPGVYELRGVWLLP